jgi:hypothetical protein
MYVTKGAAYLKAAVQLFLLIIYPKPAAMAKKGAERIGLGPPALQVWRKKTGQNVRS